MSIPKEGGFRIFYSLLLSADKQTPELSSGVIKGCKIVRRIIIDFTIWSEGQDVAQTCQRVLSKPNLEYRYCSHFFDYESGSRFLFRCREMTVPVKSVLQNQTYRSSPAAERKVMTMVAERKQYENRNMKSTLNESEVSK